VLAYLLGMALATRSLRTDAGATRRTERVHVAAVVPLKTRSDAPAARGGEGTRRERIRMELLVARARAARD
jgi:hypothetical protein